MTCKPRITFSRAADGSIAIYLNPEGRDRLVQELMLLNESNDHFHIAPEGADPVWEDLPSQKIPYHADDQIMEVGKVSLRLDSWDQQHFPHVMAGSIRNVR